MGARRNLLIVLTAGQRGDALGGAEAWPIDTPHLDELASNGLAVTAISPTIDPAASLMSLYTGLHPRQRDWTAGGGRCGGFMRRLREAGYYTAGVGRVGPVADALDEHVIVADVDQLDPAGCQYLRCAERRGWMGRVEMQRQTRSRGGPFELPRTVAAGAGLEAGEDVDGYIGAEAAAMIERLPTDRPWAMVVAFTGPGNDLPAPAMYYQAVENDGLADGFVPAAVGELDRYAHLDYPRTLLQRVNPAQAASIRRHYLGRVMLIDCCVGLMLDQMRKRSDAAASWTLLTSDRGAALGERGLFGCQTFIGSGAYVPLWITPPPEVGNDARQAHDPALRDHDELVSGVDLAATVCALGGADELPGCTGRSLLEGFHSSVGREAVISEDHRSLLLHTMRHKAVYESASGELRVLFDLKRDPQERTNLADSPYFDNVRDSLQQALATVLLPLGAGRFG